MGQEIQELRVDNPLAHERYAAKLARLKSRELALETNMTALNA